MKAVVQRVSEAVVSVDDKVVSQCSGGFLVFLGVEQDDESRDLDYIVTKISKLRIFSDNEGRMNLSLAQVGGSLLLVSQFTLLADTGKGNRPSFNKAAEPKKAEEYYERAIQGFKAQGFKVGSGVFGAMMNVSLVNDGPVTILLESPAK
jgi:D-aminoacyl-tRNA deacylase